MSQSLEQRGTRVVYPEGGTVPRVILVVGGTSRIGWLWRCRRLGARVVHRLDGINWRHRVDKTSPAGFVRSELRNWLMLFIRNYLADYVVYQSAFVQGWWHDRYGPASVPETIIHNGVDLSLFSPRENRTREDSSRTLFCAEGNIVAEPVTLEVLRTAPRRLHEQGSIQRTCVCGVISDSLCDDLADVPGLTLVGHVSREGMPARFAEGDVFLSLDILAACPNSVIEALACGVPVVGFRTGALGELVSDDAGIVVPYGGDPWKLGRPDTDALVSAVVRILGQLGEYRQGARRLAERKYGLDAMVDHYIQVFGEVLRA